MFFIDGLEENNCQGSVKYYLGKSRKIQNIPSDLL